MGLLPGYWACYHRDNGQLKTSAERNGRCCVFIFWPRSPVFFRTSTCLPITYGDRNSNILSWKRYIRTLVYTGRKYQQLLTIQICPNTEVIDPYTLGLSPLIVSYKLPYFSHSLGKYLGGNRRMNFCRNSDYNVRRKIGLITYIPLKRLKNTKIFMRFQCYYRCTCIYRGILKISNCRMVKV